MNTTPIELVQQVNNIQQDYVSSTGGGNIAASLSVQDSLVLTENTLDLSDLAISATAAEINILHGLKSTTTQLNYLSTATSNIQTQLNGKASSSHIHGNITNVGAIGTTANLPVFTTTNGVLTTKTAANALTALGLTATAKELNYMDGVTSAVQTQLNAKQATVTGAATTVTTSNLTASRALVSNSSGKIAVSAVTSTELGYLDGVTSAVQTQLNAKAPLALSTGTISFMNSFTVYDSALYTTGKIGMLFIRGMCPGYAARTQIAKLSVTSKHSWCPGVAIHGSGYNSAVAVDISGTGVFIGSENSGSVAYCHVSFACIFPIA